MWIWVLLLVFLRRCSSLSGDLPVEDIFRRNGHKAVVLGNYVYIDGGYISGTNIPVLPKRYTPANDTFAIDISKSWDPKDVAFLKQSRATMKQNVYRSGLVADESTQAIYLWGGRREVPGPKRVLWKFVPDAKGNGTWQSEATTGIDSLVSTESNAHTVAHGLGFWFGGVVNQLTDSSSNKEVGAEVGTEVPGFVTYNFTAKTWTNHTKIPDTIRTPFAATVTYIPSIGPNGIIVLLGGMSRANSAPGFDFGTIHFMDPVTMIWYAQTTSGSLPTRRMDHCAVGVQGDNNTYEIFIYGGEDKDNVDEDGRGPAYGDVWVLSLPGFVWHQADGAKIDIRTHHACVLVGKRQMLSIGGVNTTKPQSMSTMDSRPQGLGVFDMTEMKWVENYNADAATYETPKAIKKWYTDGGANSIKWGDGVQELFQNKTAPQPSTLPTAPGGGLSTGAIAGIAIGAVIGMVIMGTAAFFLIRKHQRREMKESNTPETLDSQLIELSSTWSSAPAPPEPAEMYSPHPELGGDTQRIAMRDSLLVQGQIPADRRVELHADERLEMVG